MYDVSVKDANGCLYDDQIEVLEYENINFEISDQIIACNQENVWNEFDLISGNPSEFQITWSDGSTANTINISSPGNYWVELDNQCQTVRHEFSVSYEQLDISTLMFIPNIFTPNDDGINDFMEPFVKNENETEIELFQIFDRWGNLLYKSNGSTMKWDGKYHGKTVNPGVYVWNIRAKVNACHNVQEVFKFGDVTLLR